MAAFGSSSLSDPITVIYVDPDPASRRHFVDGLESAADGVAVAAVATPTALRDALADVDGHGCVVTEYDLGETDALSLYDRLRADGVADRPFVLYTADGDETLASDAITTGLSGYVPRGGDGSIDGLLTQLRTLLEGPAHATGGETEADTPRTERELERYRTLVETVGDPMYILDATGRIEMANDAMADALGTTRAELVGTHPSRYMPADDVERAREILLELLADDDRTWSTFEMEFEPVDGEPILVENKVTPLVDESGALTGSVGAIRDISDRTERERQIRRLHEGTRRLMAAESASEVARVATEIAHDALSLEINAIHLHEDRSSQPASSDGSDGDPQTDDGTMREEGVLVPVAMTDETEALLGTVPTIGPGNSIAWDAFEAGEAIVHGDVRHAPNVRNPETPIRSEAHIPLGAEGIFIVSSTRPNDFDPETLTLAGILAANVEAALERARREDELAARTAELERQNDRLDAFASTVSHDLRNPLTLAAGRLESLEPHVDDEGERYRQEIAWALDRMDDLIENVLALARSGKRLTDTEPVDLDAVVDRAHRTVDSTLELVRDDPLPTVEADEERLLVLFENVLRNARDHVGEDVTITIEPTGDGFAIADDGPGVEPGKRDAILESGYSTDPEGTGFGLAIVTEVVDAHGWSIDVGASEAGGLRFDISTADEHGSGAVTATRDRR